MISGLLHSQMIHSCRRQRVVRSLYHALMLKRLIIVAVLIQGPYLVRDAKLSGSKLAITGDVVNATTLDIFAPKGVKSVTWNGKKVDTHSTEYGSLKGSLDAPKSIKLPALASWKSKDSLPERFADYDDSGAAWVGKLLI